jgi:cytidylate kinase
MIITISGMPGSGKSTVGRLVSKNLGYAFYSIGDLRGKWALERGMTIDELNKVGEKEDWTDKKADEWQAEAARKQENVVIDGRLSFHFIPKSFKVFLTVDPDVGAERVSGDSREDERTDGMERLKGRLAGRTESDIMRYKKYYGVDIMDMKNYDLVVDTTDMKPDEVAGRVLKEARKISD